VAEAGQGLSELAAARSSAHDGETSGKILARPEAVRVDAEIFEIFALRPGGPARARSGGKNDSTGAEDVLSSRDCLASEKARGSQADVDAEGAVALGTVVGGDRTHGAARGGEGRGSEGTGERRSETTGPLGGGRDVEERLARDAASVETVAAEGAGLDQRHRRPKATGGRRGDEPRRPAADDEEVVAGATWRGGRHAPYNNRRCADAGVRRTAMGRGPVSTGLREPVVSGGIPTPSRPALLFGWACLVCVLAASPSVPYTDSVGLFGLTLLGIGWGFRDGFVRGLTRGERLLLAVFFLVPAAALASDEMARFTRPAFRFAGRDLRFLLAVAAYGALRRLRPRPRALGALLASSAFLSLAVGLVEVTAGGAPRAAGATGVAIVFGDLAVLSGFAGAAGLLLDRDRGAPGRGVVLLALLSVGAGLAASILADARGAWLGFVVLFPLFLFALGRPGRLFRRLVGWGLVALVLAGALSAGFVLKSGLSPGTRLVHVIRDLGREERYLRFGERTTKRWALSPCFASPRGLRWMLRAVRILPVQRGDKGWIRVTRTEGLPAACRRAGGAVLALSVPYGKDVTTFLLPTALLWSGVHTAALWARGRLVVRTCSRCRPHPISARRFRDVVVRGRFIRSGALHLVLRPGERAWIVPVQSRPGEFSTAPLRNSVDERFEMWRAAWRMARRHPWWGVGFGGYASAAARLARAGRAPPFVAAYEHPHNDLLDALASGGIVGLVVLLLLYGVPLALFVRAARDPAPSVRAAASMGLLVVVGFFVFGLTEAMFVHSLVIGWYALTVGAVAAAITTARARADGRDARVDTIPR